MSDITSSGAVEKNYFYHYNASSRSRKIDGIGVEANIPFGFRLEKVDALDGLAVSLGFAKRIYTEDAAFDAQIYVYSESDAFYEMLHSNSSLRQKILDLFNSGATCIYSDKGRIIAGVSGRTQTIFSGRKTPFDGDFTNKLSAGLHAILADISTITTDQISSSLPRSAKYDKFLKSFFFIMFIIGVMAISICLSGAIYQIVDTVFLAEMAATYAVPAIVIALCILRRVMEESPYGADAFKAFVQAGIVAIAVWSFVLSYAGDIYLDSAAPTRHQQLIVKKYYTTGRHNSHSYYLVVEDWHKDGNFEVKVRQSVYNEYKPGNYLSIYSHPGALNVEWISLE